MNSSRAMPADAPRGEKHQASSSRHPVDARLGARLRQRRILLGMSQKRLGESIGVSFQQVQKYERGASRISASCLYDLSRVLDVPITYFFEGLEAPDGAEGEDKAISLEARGLKRETLELVRAYGSLPDADVRSRICDLVKSIAAAHTRKAPDGRH